MPDTTYIVRLYPYDSFTEEYEQYDRATAEDFFRTFKPYVPEQYRAIELTAYNYATHTETTIRNFTRKED